MRALCSNIEAERESEGKGGERGGLLGGRTIPKNTEIVIKLAKIVIKLITILLLFGVRDSGN